MRDAWLEYTAEAVARLSSTPRTARGFGVCTDWIGAEPGKYGTLPDFHRCTSPTCAPSSMEYRMGSKPSNNFQSDRPESGGADKDNQRAESGLPDRDKER